MLGVKKDKQPGPALADGVDLDLSLQDFLLENADPTKGHIARLFRVYKPRGSAEKSAFLQTWRDEIPDYEEIAELYGPGEYKLNLIYSPPGQGRRIVARRFAIDPHWGGGQMAGPGAAAQVAPGLDPFTAASQSRREMIEMFQMVLRTVADMNKGKANGNGSSSWLQDLQKDIGGVMVANMEANNRLIADMNRARLDLGTAEVDEDPQPFVVQAIAWLMQAWQKYGSQILQAPKQAGALLKGQAQGQPHIQYALEHPDEYQTLYSQFQQQTGAPTDKIDEFIHALGYPTPTELAASQQQETGQQ